MPVRRSELGKRANDEALLLWLLYVLEGGHEFWGQRLEWLVSEAARAGDLFCVHTALQTRPRCNARPGRPTYMFSSYSIHFIRNCNSGNSNSVPAEASEKVTLGYSNQSTHCLLAFEWRRSSKYLCLEDFSHNNTSIFKWSIHFKINYVMYSYQTSAPGHALKCHRR